MQASKYANAPAPRGPKGRPSPQPPAKTATPPPPPEPQHTYPSPPPQLEPDHTSAQPSASDTEPSPVVHEAQPTEPVSSLDGTLDVAPPESYHMDEFAQTRPPDDLFGDDFTPIDEPIVQYASTPARTTPRPRKQPPSAANGRQRPAASQPPAANVATDEANGAAQADEEPTSPSAAQPSARKAASAVRGDRSLTGGPARSKLSESELTARMEAIKLKNTAREEAHARATADEEHFQANEAEAAVRRRQERQQRQAMIGEREKNRLRKEKAMQGREWDMEKQDRAEDNRGSGSRRGAYGGVVAGVGGGRSVEGWVENQAQAAADGYVGDGNPYQGRGGHEGRGRGRGRGRGGRGRGGLQSDDRQGGGGAHIPINPQPQMPPKASDFPALPAQSSKTQPLSQKRQPPTSQASLQPSAPVAEAPSWAEEMEDSAPPPAVADLDQWESEKQGQILHPADW